ncbi:MAG: hypothetical protein ACO24Y_12790 [Hylemonella sp.]
MNHAQNEPKLLFTGLKPFYDAVEPLSWMLVRLTVGLSRRWPSPCVAAALFRWIAGLARSSERHP